MWKYLLALSAGLACGVPIWFAYTSNYWRNRNNKERPFDPDKLKPHSPDEEFHKYEDVVAKQLIQKVRILCIVTIFPSDYQEALYINATWGKRCDVLLFIGSKNHDTLPTVVLHTNSTQGFWGRTKASFKYAYEHHRESVDWILKVGSETYVIMENLRFLLSSYDSSSALYVGRYFKSGSVGYMSGPAGYVLSREAVRRLVEEGLQDKTKCRSDDGGYEDLEMGKCASALGVKAVDSRDTLNRGRFFPFKPIDQILEVNKWSPNFWYHQYNFFKDDERFRCCSSLAITFRATSSDMYTMEYLLYHLRPYGTIRNRSTYMNRRLNNSTIEDFENKKTF